MPNAIQFNPVYPPIDESEKLYARAVGLIPSVTQTLAKGPGQFTKGVAPIYLDRGKGSHVWDVDNNEYIDYNMGIGPLSLGYGYREVDIAIRLQLEKGITFSLMHPLEVEVAELIHDVIPNAEAVRFSKTGADVVSAAIRLARAYTGREKVLCCGYHGWHDWYIAVTDRNRGIPSFNDNLTYTFNYNDLDGFIASLDADVAAVILEPVVFQAPENNFLHEIADICRERGIILIFDEMWTGFRMAIGGAQEYFGITPDLATYSKAIANGMPLAVLTGRQDIMELLDKDVFFYTTFGGETLSLAAAQTTIDLMRKYNIPAYLEDKGNQLKNGLDEIIEELDMEYVKTLGYGWRSLVTFSPEAGNPLTLKAVLQQEMIKRGILWGGFHNMSYSHTDEDISYTLDAYRDALPYLKAAVDSGNPEQFMLGQPLAAVFRKTSNFNTKPRVKAEAS